MSEAKERIRFVELGADSAFHTGISPLEHQRRLGGFVSDWMASGNDERPISDRSGFSAWLIWKENLES